jgi:SAM-dependent methyltransferase
MTKHLDLGCGTRPRNPYKRDALYGIDIRDLSDLPPGVASIRGANLCIDPIPFEDQYFDSVSAFDFLEHVPRVALMSERRETIFPFVRLMNEVWRVLKPNGLFYAITPCYPHQLAFADPTHVNIVTPKTLRYFSGNEPMARMYGFHGAFSVLRQVRVHPRGDYHPERPDLTLWTKIVADTVMRRRSHLVWELRALKA